MKPAENNIEKQIKNLRTQASAELDEKLHHKFRQALGKEKATTAFHQPIQRTAILHSRIIKLAAAAVVIVAVCWLAARQKEVPQQPGTNKAAAATIFETPAELVSIISLNMAFRDGGMEAVEEQFDKAAKKVKAGLNENISIDELICELDGC